jgi:hypothetical protein
MGNYDISYNLIYIYMEIIIIIIIIIINKI